MTNNNIVVKTKLMRETSVLPFQASNGAAGFDLFADITAPIVIMPGEVVKIPTGVSFEIPPYFVGLLYPRSSMGIKENLVLANGTGVIDSDYRGEVIAAIYNYGKEPRTIHMGQRVAQIVFQPVAKTEILKVDKLNDSARGECGFGSTGKF